MYMQLQQLNLNNHTCTVQLPLTWNLTSSNKHVSSLSEYYAKLSSIEEIFEKRVRFSLLSSIEWWRYSWVSSDHIYILEYREDFPRYASTTFVYYRCIIYYTLALSIQYQCTCKFLISRSIWKQIMIIKHETLWGQLLFISVDELFMRTTCKSTCGSQAQIAMCSSNMIDTCTGTTKSGDVFQQYLHVFSV